MTESISYGDLVAQIEELKVQLLESQNIIEAIRTGEVDAFVFKNDDKHEIYTLKSADHTYRVFIEKMAEGAVTINSEGIILYCNSSFANMVGLPFEELLATFFVDHIPEQYKEVVSRYLMEGWKKEVKAEISLVSNQKSTPVLMSINEMTIDEGPALSIILTDLTYQKQVQQQLHDLNQQLEQTIRERTNELFRSREHFKFLADNIPAIIWSANANGTPDYFNNRWFDFTGAHVITSDSFHSSIHPDDASTYMEDWDRAVKNGTSFQMVHRIREGATDNYKWHFTQAIPYRNDNNDLVSWFGISTDINEQKLALEKKDEFITIASHELKTPVTSIKGYVQVLQYKFKKDGNQEAADMLQKADTQINKLTGLITDLLDVKRIENGQFRYEQVTFDFDELVREINEETGRVVKTHRLGCHLDANCFISGDRNKIGQVMTNFIDNAAKYSPVGTQIEVETKVINNCVHFSVTDFGIGIPKEQIPNIFDRFFRVTGDKPNTYSGLGLGLYISSEIIKRHNGRIGVESEKDKGSRFYFELPV